MTISPAEKKIRPVVKTENKQLRALGADITLVDEPDEPERAAVS